MEALLVSTAVVALAEIGDKTQLLALLLAARFRKPVPIVLGILVATLANHARHVYCVGWRIKGVKSAGFELLNSHHARTADAVIFGGARIEGANPQEFKIIDEYRGRDNQQVYAYGRAEEKPAFSIVGTESGFDGRTPLGPARCRPWASWSWCWPLADLAV